MIQASLELYLDGQWKEFHLYNQLVFDERKDGQLASGMCYIRTKEKVRFKPMRKARLNLIEDDVVKKQYYYFAYFKSQKTDLEYWMHEVTLIDPAKRVQGEMINGLRVVQNESNSISLYRTFQRLCDTTPLRLTTQENVYNPTTDSEIVTLMQKIRSPEYAWSCRTLFWECLKEIGMDMGGYFPTVSFGENGKYVISFIPTENIVKTVTDFPYFSYAEGEDINQVCSEIDTDISNVIATNQGTASVVFPSQNGWITPRTDDVRLTDSNCEIQTPNIIEKPIKILIQTNGITVNSDDPIDLGKLLGISELDITNYIPEYKKYQALNDEGLNYRLYMTDLCRNNACYWIENSNKIKIVSDSYYCGIAFGKKPAIYIAITSAVYAKYGVGGNRAFINVNGKEIAFTGPFSTSVTKNSPCNFKFRVEYVARDTSTKLRTVKQEKCSYEYVQPFNQRAEIVDAPALGNEMDKTVNQMGVPYIKAAWRYKSLSDILPIGTAFVKDSETYILTVNECELTSHDNILVTHTFSKNWSMISSYLKQNKQYRNTKIPTDILSSNLHYQDYFVISDKEEEGEVGLLSLYGGISYASSVFGDRVTDQTEVNNFAIYRTNGGLGTGAVISANSFAIKKSLVFAAQLQNNMTAGKQVDPDNEYYCKEVLYAGNNGIIIEGLMEFGIGLNNINAYSLPFSDKGTGENIIKNPIVSREFRIEKSSAMQISMTYQVHFVSDMHDIIIGGLLAENNPLIRDVDKDFKYQLWGLKRPLPKTAIIVDSTFGQKVADINSANKVNFWRVSMGEKTSANIVKNRNFNIRLLSGILRGDYIGWAITDENGTLYLARNSSPNVEQTLFFNHLHKYHEQD